MQSVLVGEVNAFSIAKTKEILVWDYLVEVANWFEGDYIQI